MMIKNKDMSLGPKEAFERDLLKMIALIEEASFLAKSDGIVEVELQKGGGYLGAGLPFSEEKQAKILEKFEEMGIIKELNISSGAKRWGARLGY